MQSHRPETIASRGSPQETEERAAPIRPASSPGEGASERFRGRPIFLLSVIVVVVALVEFGLMLALARVPSVNGFRAALIDSMVLVTIVFPALLILVFRPLQQQIAWRREKELALVRTIEQLERSQAEVRRLRGLLPICASCKRIRDIGDHWAQLEQYIEAHSDASFTHSICPDCVQKLYPAHAQRAGGATRQ